MQATDTSRRERFCSSACMCSCTAFQCMYRPRVLLCKTPLSTHLFKNSTFFFFHFLFDVLLLSLGLGSELHTRSQESLTERCPCSRQGRYGKQTKSRTAYTPRLHLQVHTLTEARRHTCIHAETCLAVKKRQIDRKKARGYAEPPQTTLRCRYALSTLGAGPAPGMDDGKEDSPGETQHKERSAANVPTRRCINTKTYQRLGLPHT